MAANVPYHLEPKEGNGNMTTTIAKSRSNKPGRPPLNSDPVALWDVRWGSPQFDYGVKRTGDDGHTWYERLMPLRTQPKRWAIIRSYDLMPPAKNAASNLRNRVIRKPAGQWEFQYAPEVVITDDGGYGLIWNVYARYLSRYVPKNGNGRG